MKLSNKFTTVTTLSKLLAMTLFIILPFVGFYLGMNYQGIIDIPNSVSVQTKNTQTNFSCNEDLRLIETSAKLNGNKTAIETIIKNCQWLMGVFSADVENNGSNDSIFWAAGAGCVSCHAQTMYVLSGSKIVFQKELDDPVIGTEIINGKNALVITEPIRKQNESLSNPSLGIKTRYLWNDLKGIFYIYDTQQINYNNVK